MTRDAEERLAAWLDTTSGQLLMPDHAAADARAVLQALADTRQQLDEAQHQTRADLTAAIDYRADRQKAYDLIEKLNRRIAAVFDLGADAHAAERHVTGAEILAAIDTGPSVGRAYSNLRAERDEAQRIARILVRHVGVVATAALCRNKLELDQLPDWLTDDPQPDPGPTRQDHDGAQTAQEPRRDDRSTPTDTDATRHAEAPQNGATELPPIRVVTYPEIDYPQELRDMHEPMPLDHLIEAYENQLANDDGSGT